MKNMKFRIESEDHGENIRSELKRIGVDTEPWYHNYKYVISYNGIVCGFTDNEEHFLSSLATETTLEELKAM